LQACTINRESGFRGLAREIASKYPHNVAQSRCPKIRPKLGVSCRRLLIVRFESRRLHDFSSQSTTSFDENAKRATPIVRLLVGNATNIARGGTVFHQSKHACILPCTARTGRIAHLRSCNAIDSHFFQGRAEPTEHPSVVAGSIRSTARTTRVFWKDGHTPCM
jgi:hypothetical protein